MKTKKVIISGGGTGGHIYPAVAIANELKSIDPTIEILFVGAEGKMEMQKVPKAGYEIIGLPIAGFNRSNLVANIGFPLKLMKSLAKARKVIKTFKPDAVVGVGGYASGPTLFLASMAGIPTLLQEQNSYAGVTNKLLAKNAAKICVAYPNMEAFFPNEKIIQTGNPVRKDIIEIKCTKGDALQFFGLSENKQTLLVIGGSQGARTINEAIFEGIEEIISNDIQLIWQTGTGFIEKAKQRVAELNTPNVMVADFIYEMDKAYQAADFVVSRAGALSVSELSLVGKPCILVPFPLAAEDHQTKNAMSLVNANAAWLVKDSETKSQLVSKAIELSRATEEKIQLAKNILTLGRPNAGKQIAEEVLKLIK